MPIEIYWLVETRVGFCKYMGDVTVDEIRESVEVGVSMIDTVPENITFGHTILDGSQVTSFPRNIKQVNDAGLALRSHPKMGWTVTASVLDKTVAFIANMVSQITRTRSRNLPTVEDALKFLNQVDLSLPNLSEIDLTKLELVQRIDNSQETQNSN